MIQEQQLGQLRPANTTAASLYTSSNTWVAKNLVICNTSSGLAKARVFYDASGTTYDETTALLWDIEVEPGESAFVDNFFAGNSASGNFGVRTDTANALTFTLYGAVIT
jgi:hypothetical protein